jgi:hypothetical protein
MVQNGDLLAGSHNILNRWNNFPQLLNVRVHRVGDVRQIKVHTAEPLVPSEDEIVMANLKRYKSPGSD